MVERISETFFSTAESDFTSISNLGQISLALFVFSKALLTEEASSSVAQALTKTPTNAPVTTFAIRLFRMINPRYFSVV